MPFPSANAYQSSRACVAWQGERAVSGAGLNDFLRGAVAARLNDAEGSKELSHFLRGLSLTGMGQEALREVLEADLPEDRDWAAGEALAEAFLEAHHGVVLPWNTERDKRNPFGSLPGADIVGFQQENDTHRLVLGEVKCSSENRSPPQVMSGRSGMVHQLEILATDLGILCQLLTWLFHRVKRTEHETAFNGACTRYFDSGKRAVSFYGVLIRDQLPQESDLRGRAEALANTLQAPTSCQLIGLYLPWPIAQLPSEVRGGGAT